MSNHLPGFQSIIRFLHHLILANLATSIIRVKGECGILREQQINEYRLHVQESGACASSHGVCSLSGRVRAKNVLSKSRITIQAGKIHMSHRFSEPKGIYN